MEEKRARQKTETTILDLHADLLLLIFHRLDQESLQSISLVSPSFVTLTNNLITKLTFRRPLPDSTFRKIFRRFPSVNEISLTSIHISHALTAISNSSLNLEALRIYGRPTYPDQSTMLNLKTSPGRLRNVKSLQLRKFAEVGLGKMIEFIKLFPSIDDLDLSSCGRWDDRGVRNLSLIVPQLRRINLSGNELLTDHSLQFLSACCVDMEQFCFDGSSGMSPQGLCAFLCKMPNLSSLRLPVFSKVFTQAGLLQLGWTISNFKHLKHLAISHNLVNDNILVAIARLNLPLMSLEVEKHGTRGLYTMAGLTTLLGASQGLTRLEVCLPKLDLGNQDGKMSQLVKLLPFLRHIRIHTSNWFHETLFSLIDNCPKLESISISGNKGKCETDFYIPPPTNKNYSIEFIRIGPRLEQSLRTTLELSCPLLKQLKCC